MKDNRSMPNAKVVPVLSYPDVSTAVDWLCNTFGFSQRLKIGNHRVQLNVGKESIIIREGGNDMSDSASPRCHSIMIRVNDIDDHYNKVKGLGAKIIHPPTDQVYGERQYSVEDLTGNLWTFSQTIADVIPEEWGGTSINL